jgi:hypothetical protein
MAITYTWKVTGVKTRAEGSYQDAVVQTYWEKIGTDETGVEGKFSGATPFTTANMPPDQTYVPFNQLTEAIVLGWIQAAVTGGYEQHVNEQIQKQIDLKKNPIADAQMPWAPATVAPAPTPTGT